MISIFSDLSNSNLSNYAHDHLVVTIRGFAFTIRTLEPIDVNTGKSQVFALNSDEVASVMATVNTYHFNVFQLLDAGQGKGMRYLLGELLSTYGLIGNAIIEI